MPPNASSHPEAIIDRYVLSVRQPYAQLLVTADGVHPRLPIKWCENRSWLPAEKHLGQRFFIHASSKPVSDHETDAALQLMHDRHLDPDYPSCPTSCLIGSVRLVGCVSALDRFATRKTIVTAYQQARQLLRPFTAKPLSRLPTERLAAFGCHWWLVADPIEFATPISCQGRLNLWQASKFLNSLQRQQLLAACAAAGDGLSPSSPA